MGSPLFFGVRMNTRQRQILQSFFEDLEEMEGKIKKMKLAIENMLISDTKFIIPVAEYSFIPNPPGKDKEREDT